MLRTAGRNVPRKLDILGTTFNLKATTIEQKNDLLLKLRMKHDDALTDEGILVTFYKCIDVICEVIISIDGFPEQEPVDVLKDLEFHSDLIKIITAITDYCSLGSDESKNSEDSLQPSSPSSGTETVVEKDAEQEETLVPISTTVLPQED